MSCGCVGRGRLMSGRNGRGRINSCRDGAHRVPIRCVPGGQGRSITFGAHRLPIRCVPGGHGRSITSGTQRLPIRCVPGAQGRSISGTTVMPGTVGVPMQIRPRRSGLCPGGQHWPPLVIWLRGQHSPLSARTVPRGHTLGRSMTGGTIGTRVVTGTQVRRRASGRWPAGQHTPSAVIWLREAALAVARRDIIGRASRRGRRSAEHPDGPAGLPARA